MESSRDKPRRRAVPISALILQNARGLIALAIFALGAWILVYNTRSLFDDWALKACFEQRARRGSPYQEVRQGLIKFGENKDLDIRYGFVMYRAYTVSGDGEVLGKSEDHKQGRLLIAGKACKVSLALCLRNSLLESYSTGPRDEMVYGIREGARVTVIGREKMEGEGPCFHGQVFAAKPGEIEDSLEGLSVKKLFSLLAIIVIFGGLEILILSFR